MKVVEHYDKANNPLISFEIIPPKRGSSIKPIFDSLDQVMRFNPPFIDVTSHAAEAYYEEQNDGSVKRHIKRKRPGTIGISAAIKHKYGVDPVPHIICKGFTKEETEDALIELNFLGIHNILAIRGDDHAAPKQVRPERSTNNYAIDLVQQIDGMNKGLYLEDLVGAEPTEFCIGVSGYPEKHFEAPNMKRDLIRLKEKVDAGADYIVTQMFYDNKVFFEFVDQCRELGITCPIVPGLKVLTMPKHLTTIPKAFFINLPDTLASEVEKNPTRAREIGIEWATMQSKELLENDVCGLHFYIMANPSPAIEVLNNLGF